MKTNPGMGIHTNLLFEEEVHLTTITEYGYSLKAVMTNESPIPSRGVRFDISFEGTIRGNRLNGIVTGTDYLTVRPDGRFLLNLQARIETEDGAIIKLEERGSNTEGRLCLYMNFHTHDARYLWLNQTEVVGLGHVDFTTGIAKIAGYQL